MEEEFKSQCIVRLETSCRHSGSARQRARASQNALREFDNKHEAGGGEAAQAAGICHTLRGRTRLKVTTRTGLFVHLCGLEDCNNGVVNKD